MSAVSMFYYLRLVVAMYLREGHDAEVVITPALRFVAGLALVVTLALGLYPPPLIRQVAFSAGRIVLQSAGTAPARRLSARRSEARRGADARGLFLRRG